jgi:diacylglycerol kinase family enzyme
VAVDTNPAMPVMADGLALGEGPLRISILRHAVPVMVGASVPKVLPA